MIEIILIELVLLGIPIATYLLTKFLLKTERAYKLILTISLAILALGLASCWAKLSFVTLAMNIIAASILFAALCLCVWIIPKLIKTQTLRIVSRVILMFPIVLSVFYGTIGILGVMFIVGDFNPDRKLQLSEELTYKENKIEGVFSKSHLVVTVTERIDGMGLLERQIIKKDYYSITAAHSEIKINYKNGILELEASTNDSSRFNDSFSDTIVIKMR